MRYGRMLVGMMVSAVVIAGCGSSSSSGGSSGLSKAQLASKTESVCKASADKIRGISQPSDFATNADAAAAYLDKVDAVYKDAQQQLSAVKPADSLKSQWATINSKLGAVVKVVDDVTQKAHKHDKSGLTQLQSLGGLTSSLNQATQAIGANCASA
jgi:hypothetical protein